LGNATAVAVAEQVDSTVAVTWKLLVAVPAFATPAVMIPTAKVADKNLRMKAPGEVVLLDGT
jgi:hypothetical protein